MWQTKYALAYLKIWDWDWIFGRAAKAIYFLGVRNPCHILKQNNTAHPWRILLFLNLYSNQIPHCSIYLISRKTGNDTHKYCSPCTPATNHNMKKEKKMHTRNSYRNRRIFVRDVWTGLKKKRKRVRLFHMVVRLLQKIESLMVNQIST